MGLFRKLAVNMMKSSKNLLAANPRLRLLLYDLSNEKEFGNLYEHEKMLADSVRIDTYKKGIEKYVKTGDTVLDLGTGSGILSFFAAGKKPKKIYAIDHSGFIDIAREIARQNGVENIEFIRSNSRNFKSEEKMDVIIHEQMGDYLFNENMIHNLLDLKKRFLKPGGRVIPGRFELFLEPACLAETFKTPFIWENRLHGIDFRFLREHQALKAYQPSDYNQVWIESNAADHFLCEPEPVLAFDLNEMNSEEEIPRRLEITKKVATPGSLDGFCLYFGVKFDEEIRFDTSPLSRNTHWGNCFFRAESRKYSEGESIEFELVMEDLLNIKTWSATAK